MDKNVFVCQEFFLQSIKTMEDVKQFAKYLVYRLKINFHPDDDFSSYGRLESIGRELTLSEIKQGNTLMDECFSVCEKENQDVYGVMGRYLINSIICLS
jgi:hypothetical protein